MGHCIVLLKTCPMCEHKYRFILNEQQERNLHKYEAKEGLIQDLFPEINSVEREWIKSGYCPECQEMLFGNGQTELLEEVYSG